MKIRIALLNYEKPTASDRRRRLSLINFLQHKGEDVGLYQEGEDFDVLIVANRHFERWLHIIESAQNRCQVVIFDITDNILQSGFLTTHLGLIHRFGILAKRLVRAMMGKRWPSPIAEEFWKKCDGIVTGSKEQARIFAAYNKHVVDIVDPVDLNEYNTVKIHKSRSLPVVVWEGTADNLPYLRVCAKPLSLLIKEGIISLKVVTDRYRNSRYWGTKDNRKLMRKMGLKGEFVEWQLTTFAKELAHADIGIAPLPSYDPFAFTKPANKILGYMAIGLPVVASGTPAYKEILSKGKFGFVAENELEWYQALKRLAQDPYLRQEMGKSGRSFILKEYTLSHYVERYMTFIQECLASK